MGTHLKTSPSRVHFRERDLQRGVIAIDRPIDADLVWTTEIAITVTSGLVFVPVVRIPKLGYMAKRFSWWPFGRHYQLHVKQVAK